MEKADSGTSLVLGQQMPNRQILGQIGYMAQSDALYETLTAVVMPQVFFSGIVPLDALPNWIQVISKILPLTYAGNAMNDVIMKGQGVETIAGDLGVLALFIVFFVVLNVVGLKRYRKV